MNKLLALLLLLPALLKAQIDMLFSEGEDLNLNQHVNVISGNLNLQFEDAIIQGATPFPLIRTYTSGTANQLFLKNSLIQDGWIFLPHVNLILELSSKEHFDKQMRIILPEKNGAMITYAVEKIEREKKLDHTNFATGCEKCDLEVFVLKPQVKAGPCSGVVSARTNVGNNIIRFYPQRKMAIVYLADGSVLRYEHLDSKSSFLSLSSQTFPNQHCAIYSYDKEHRLANISLYNPSKSKLFSSLNFNTSTSKTDQENSLECQINTSDNKEIYYSCKTFKEETLLCEVRGNGCPNGQMYLKAASKDRLAGMNALSLNGNLALNVRYYGEEKKCQEECNAVGKVHVIEGPMGSNGAFIPIAQFSYSDNYTDVRDVENLLTRYHHDTDKLKEIEYFDDHHKLHSILRFGWDNCYLKSKTLLKSPSEGLFAKTFAYDDVGNIIEETLWGNLTGKIQEIFSLDPHGFLQGAESYSKRYGYLPGFNLLSWEEEEQGPTYKYIYKPNTSLLTGRFICNEEDIVIRHFLFYDNDNLLICEITDDGCSQNPDDLSCVSQRQIKRYTLDPHSGLQIACTQTAWDRQTNREILLKRTEFSYSAEKRVIAEAVYDANNVYRYTIHTDYDSYGRVILKTTPNGQRNTYRFDTQGNLIELKEVGSVKKIYTYSPSRQPIQCEEIGFDATRKISSTAYDAKGRLLCYTDTRGNTTLQTFDLFGKPLSAQFPLVKNQNAQPYHPTAHFSYDALGNLIATHSAGVDAAFTTYNSMRKAICITYPDGSCIRHLYNKNATLAQTIYPDQTQVDYTYDFLQRMRKKTILSANKTLLAEEKWEFNAFHLISHTDPNGLITYFEYDAAGRKIAQTSADRRQCFTYDALGFLETISDGNVTEVTLHDEGGRIIEQYNEHSNGRIENRVYFFYDEEGYKIRADKLTCQGIATDHFAYDAQGRLCRHTNPLGSVTEFLYTDIPNDLGQLVLSKTTIDPLGNQTIEIFDALLHIISTEKKDPLGNSVYLEEYSYDAAGNKSARLCSVFQNNKLVRTISTYWKHDSLGNLIQENESDQKITKYTYDEQRRLRTKTLPSGISLFYSYDGIDRLTSLSSSDATISYTYHYDVGSLQPYAIVDHITHTQLNRTYDLFGQLIEETNPLGLTYRWNYDQQGRCTQFTLPDSSSITYHYEGAHLSCIQRVHLGKTLYQHCYTAFDLNGHVTQEELIHDLGSIKTYYDLLERPSSYTSDWMSHEVCYAASGLVTCKSNSLLGKKEYGYDALNQLIYESDQSYNLDSLGNPIDSVVNECNQLLTSSDICLSYDPDGNPIQRQTPQETLSYAYDALGRLICISGLDRKVTYLYDPLSRLLEKQTTTSSGQERLLYLYDDEYEIGTMRENAKIQELKVLGLGIKNDIGAAVAIELASEVFAPLHDFSGNVIALLSTHKYIAEYYPSNAFGRETISRAPAQNPWRFSSKRSEENLIFFGKRFYDPSLYRWLTPDPAGFTEGPNLYLFVLNNPTNRLDLFGLFSVPSSAQSESSQVQYGELFLLKSYMHSRDPFFWKESVGGVEMDLVLSCGHWHKLQFTPEELKTGQVHIFDHISELVPKEGLGIGLITAQNGIQTSAREFRKMSKSIINKTPESVLFIGLHNPPSNIFGDLLRLHREKNSIETATVCRTRQFMQAIVENLAQANPELFWMHISHSEGGLIANNAIAGMDGDTLAQLKEHLLSLSFGPVHPIPKSFAFTAVNIYSKKDYLAKRYATPFLHDPEYDIRIVKCKSPRRKRNFFFADHQFMGITYQEQLERKIDDTRQQMGIYDDPHR